MPLSPANLLDIWEYAHPHRGRPAQRAYVLRQTDVELDQANRQLLSAYETTFGPRLEAMADCPQCGQKVQMLFSAGDIRQSLGPSPDYSEEDCKLEIDGYRIHVRPLTLEDLLECSRFHDLAEIKTALLRCAVLSVQYQGAAIGVETLPEKIVHEITAKLEKVQPAAAIRVGLCCDACKAEWDAGLDLSAQYWTELDSAAGEVQREVAVLARHFGWSEPAVLELSNWRRRSYLRLLEEGSRTPMGSRP